MIRAPVSDADIAALVATWEAQRAVVGHLSPNLRYGAWMPASCRGFLSLATVARMDDATGSFCVLSRNAETGEYEVVPGIRDPLSFGACFRACAVTRPLTAVVYGSSPEDGPPVVIAWLNARFAHTTTGGVITWRATVAQVLAAVP